MKGTAKSSSRSRKSYVAENGYRKFKDSDTYVHRWAGEKKLGRKLKSGEVVHHINGNKLDNSPQNLKVYKNHSQHMKNEHN